jgi:large subunit ribosomal protein L21
MWSLSVYMAKTTEKIKPVKKAVPPKSAVKKETKKETIEASKEFAVIATGGKQYKVAVGDVLKVEKLDGNFSAGDKVIFDKVLLVDNGVDTTIGSPYIANAKVESLFQKSGKGKTVKVVKYKQKSRYLKRNGHRQPFIEVKISAIK